METALTHYQFGNGDGIGSEVGEGSGGGNTSEATEVEGESGTIYENTHEVAPIGQGGGIDSINPA